MKNYFEVPTQVKFYNGHVGPHYGIAYHDEIICACCGRVFEVAGVEEVKELAWINFKDSIAEEE